MLQFGSYGKNERGEQLNDIISIIFLGSWTGLASFFGFRRSALIMIVEVGINPRFYPKGYTQPKKWMKKFFRIKKQMIPKYLYIQLVLSIALVVFEFVNIFIYLCFKDKPLFWHASNDTCCLNSY